ncbi:MAG: flagellar protein FlbB [Rhodopseudomonas sp.]|nr:flagellar protein FlbB [Rhodopseudomonas sp.]
MIGKARDFRLIPVVILAAICLFVLKVSGIVFDGGYTMAERMQQLDKNALKVTDPATVPDYPKIVVADETTPAPATARLPWAKEMFNYSADGKNDVTGSVDQTKAAASRSKAATGMAKVQPQPQDMSGDITGSSGGEGEKKADAGPPLPTSEKPPAGAKLDVGGDISPLENGKVNSPGERAILGRLQDRREALDNRARELDMRESLIKAAEKRLEAKVDELKQVEARIKVETGARDKAEADRFKGIVSMYENMKPKDAARIFDRLNLAILVEVATAMKPRSMSEILAQMGSEAAERLTVELANRARAQQPASGGADQLPKISGKPGNS